MTRHLADISRGVDPEVRGVLTHLKNVGGSECVLTLENATFFHSKLVV